MIASPGQRPHRAGVTGRGPQREAAVLRILHREAVWDQGLDRGGPSPTSVPWFWWRQSSFFPSTVYGVSTRVPMGPAHLSGEPQASPVLTRALHPPRLFLRTETTGSQNTALWIPSLACALSEGCHKGSGCPLSWNGLTLSCWAHVTASERTSAEGTLATCQARVSLGGLYSVNLSMVG